MTPIKEQAAGAEVIINEAFNTVFPSLTEESARDFGSLKKKRKINYNLFNIVIKGNYICFLSTGNTKKVQENRIIRK